MIWYVVGSVHGVKIVPDGDIQKSEQNPELSGAHLRRGFFTSFKDGMEAVNKAYSVESKHVRMADYPSFILLPLSCTLLLTTVFLQVSTSIKMLAFLLPVVMCVYYIFGRIGIFSTMNTRQVYMAWTLVISSFLLGIAFSLFMLALRTVVMEILAQ